MIKIKEVFKYILPLFIFLAVEKTVAQGVMSSQDTLYDKLSFKGGHAAFRRFINKRLSYDYGDQFPAKNYSQIATFVVDSGNHIKNIYVYSFGDTIYSNMDRVISKMAGNWTNLTGQDQFVLIRFNYYYMISDRRSILPPLNFYLHYFEHGEKKQPAFSDLIETEAFPPQK